MKMHFSISKLVLTHVGGVDKFADIIGSSFLEFNWKRLELVSPMYILYTTAVGYCYTRSTRLVNLFTIDIVHYRSFTSRFNGNAKKTHLSSLIHTCICAHLYMCIFLYEKLCKENRTICLFMVFAHEQLLTVTFITWSGNSTEQ